MHNADSLFCTVEINTTLQSNYTPIKILKKYSGVKAMHQDIHSAECQQNTKMWHCDNNNIKESVEALEVISFKLLIL